MKATTILFGPFGKMRNEMIVTLKQGERYRPVALRISAFGFDMPLFMTAVWIAKYSFKPVMGAKSPEHVRQLSFPLLSIWTTAADRLSNQIRCGTPPICSKTCFNASRKHSWFSAGTGYTNAALLYGNDNTSNLYETS